MNRHIIVESGDHMVGPSVVDVYHGRAFALAHMDHIRHTHRIDGFTIVENTDTCFTVSRGEETRTFALSWVQFN